MKPAFRANSFSTSLYVRKTDGLSYSPYMDYNCKVLEDAAECESDLLLAALARLQFISEAFHRNVLSNIRDGADTKTSTPSWMLTKAARTELQSLWMSFPPDLRQNRKYSLLCPILGLFHFITNTGTSHPHYELS